MTESYPANVTNETLSNTSATLGTSASEDGQLVVAILMTLLAAAFVALSMNVQRYALAYPTDEVPFLVMRLRRKWVWFIGLLLYIVANCFKVYGFNNGPMAVLARLSDARTRPVSSPPAKGLYQYPRMPMARSPSRHRAPILVIQRL